MPLKKSSDESDSNQRQIHINSSVISIHNKRRHQTNSEEYLNSNYKHSVITKSKRDRFYNEEIDKQYHSNYKSVKVETYRETYKEESHYKNKRSRISEEFIEKDIKKSDRSSHKNKDQSNKRESRKHKKTRDHKDKSKRDKYQSKSKKDNKRRKSNNEDEPDSKRSNQPFAYNNDYSNIDSDANNDDKPNLNFSSIEPNPNDEINDSRRNSVSSIIEKNLDVLLETEMIVKEEYHDSMENDDETQTKEYSDEELENSEDYDQETYQHYPTRSKFESLTSDESEIENLRNNDHSYERDSRSVSSESSSSESFGSSISSSRNPKKNRKKSENINQSQYLEDYADKLVFSPVKEPESEEEVDIRPLYYPAVQGCRLVEEFECLNKIEEGTYGVVFRARDRKTNEIVALKRLKMEKERDGFPITSLREINTLMKAQHENIVTVREVVVGSNMDKIYLVMDFIEHDLKSLMISMVKPFEICEVKCLMLQLLSAVAHLHDNWILHRDLKTSNLLLSHKGVLKVADFGLAREYGSPLKNYTRVVVTLWYRAPELLLGTKIYSTQIDLWSVGCIFGELLLMMPLFPGKSEADQINILFKELGTPSEKIWPGVSNLPNIKRFEFGKFEYNRLGKKFNMTLSETGLELINRFLAYCPERRITAEEALNHSYFNESPKAISSEMFPTRPAKSEGGVFLRSRVNASPKPPSGGQGVNKLNDDKILGLENLYNRRG